MEPSHLTCSGGGSHALSIVGSLLEVDDEDYDTQYAGMYSTNTSKMKVRYHSVDILPAV